MHTDELREILRTTLDANPAIADVDVDGTGLLLTAADGEEYAIAIAWAGGLHPDRDLAADAASREAFAAQMESRTAPAGGWAARAIEAEQGESEYRELLDHAVERAEAAELDLEAARGEISVLRDQRDRARQARDQARRGSVVDG